MGKCYLFILEIKQAVWVLVSWTWVVLNVCFFCSQSHEKPSRYILLGNYGPLWLDISSLVLSSTYNIGHLHICWCNGSPLRIQVCLPMDTLQALAPHPEKCHVGCSMDIALTPVEFCWWRDRNRGEITVEYRRNVGWTWLGQAGISIHYITHPLWCWKNAVPIDLA